MRGDGPASTTIPEGASSTCDLSVVIPVYNEEQNLKPLYQELKVVLDELGLSYEIIYIDDGSQDSSYEILNELHTRDKLIKVIQFRRNFGQTASFAAGFDFAQGDLIVTLDADGQNDPADIPKLLSKFKDGDYDLVNGWRVDRQEPFIRRFVSRTANALINRSTQITIHDRGCSLKIFKRDLVKHLRLYGQLHRFLPELASAVGAYVTEVPVNDRARAHGQSKYGSLSRTPRVMLDLVTIIYFLSFFTNPMRFFGTSALISSVVGLIIGSSLVFTKIYYGIRDGWAGFHAYEIGNRPLLLLSIFLILLGVQFFMMGILGEMIMRTYYEARDKPTYYIRHILA